MANTNVGTNLKTKSLELKKWFMDLDAKAGAVEVLRRGYQRRYAGGNACCSSHQTSKGKK